jgi:hypothetical protein
MTILKNIFISLVITIVLLEFILRLSGLIFFEKPTSSNLKGQNPLRVDAEIGWDNNPGALIGGHNQPYTILPSSDRATTDNALITKNDNNQSFDFYGCSFTNGGWNLNNNQSYPSVVQQLSPSWAVRNFGVWAYSTIQARMLAERQINNNDSAKVVLYGFVGFHSARNAAIPGWTIPMSNSNYFNEFFIPSAIQYSGTNQYYNHSIIKMPFRDMLLTARAIEVIIEHLRFILSNKDPIQLTLSEINSFSQSVENNGKRFIIVLLADFNPRMDEIIKGINAYSLEMIDCRYPGDISKFAIPEDGHPNAELHSYWGNCVFNYLKNHPSES